MDEPDCKWTVTIECSASGEGEGSSKIVISGEWTRDGGQRAPIECIANDLAFALLSTQAAGHYIPQLGEDPADAFADTYAEGTIKRAD